MAAASGVLGQTAGDLRLHTDRIGLAPVDNLRRQACHLGQGVLEGEHLFTRQQGGLSFWAAHLLGDGFTAGAAASVRLETTVNAGVMWIDP